MKGPINKDYLLHRGKAESLDKICSLDLTNLGLGCIEADLFNKLVCLKTLDVSQNHLTSFPEGIRLKKLSVLDCCDNNLESVNFVKLFPHLRELYIEGNEKINESDRYIAKLLCPSLQRIDETTDMGLITTGISLYRSQLAPQVQAVWEARFAEVYSKGVEEEELDSLLKEFVGTVKGGGLVGENLTMPKLRNIMIDLLCMDVLISVNDGTYSNGRRQKTDKYSTRVSLGSTPVKDYRQLNTGEKVPSSGTPKSKTPDNSSRLDKPNANSTAKRKRETSPSDSPAAKRHRKDEDIVPSTVLNVKGTPSAKLCFEGSDGHLPGVDDFEPSLFIRCHSKNNDPGDDSTKVWKCAFEPQLGKAGKTTTTTTLATCGDKIVCFIDCQTGKVMKRYKDSSKTESFYTLAWTTLKADGENLKEDVNILAVAGEDRVIKLIHPRQLVMLGTLEGHKGYVSSLVFHPEKPNILFSGSRDNKVIMWEIGAPDFKDNSIDWSKKALLSLPRTDAISMVVDPKLDLLVAGCEQSCYGWDLKSLAKKRSISDVSPHFEFVHPRDSSEEESDIVVDGLVFLSKHCIVSKCVGQGCLYVWDVRAHTEDIRRSSKLSRIPVKPLAQLGYTPVDVDYLYPHASKGVLCIGDDEGKIHMYNIKSLVKNRQRCDQILKASSILDLPELIADKAYKQSMTDLADTEDTDVVVNCTALSSNHEYLAYGTDNNIVCIWKNTSR